MKVVILAGGYGTRLSEETDIRPKPMVQIGGKPILWHIMKIYSHYGFNDFVILLGYKGYFIKEYFANYYLHQSDITLDMQTGDMKVHNNASEPWKVTLLDTGLDSETGGRIKRAKEYIGDETFMLTYGDGVGDIDVKQLLVTHKKSTSLLTMTSVQPEGRYGSLHIENEKITKFIEKPKGDNAWINGGFMVCEPEVFGYIKDDMTIFEQKPLQKMASEGKLTSYKHNGFWKCMDTLRDKHVLNKMWENDNAKWKVWK